jgi:hypothetical protein
MAEDEMRAVLCNAFEGIKAQSLAESGDQRAQELRWPGSLLPCDHGLLCAIALTLQGKRKVGARTKERT